MKAAIYMGKESIEIKDLPMPECGDDDVIIQNIYSSICGTDVAVYTHGPGTGHKITVGGEFGKYPDSPGKEKSFSLCGK